MSSGHTRVTLVPRFAVSVRIAHWLLAAAFASMLGSGVLMGGLGPLDHRAMLVVHVGSAIVLVAGLAGLIAVRRSRRPLARLVGDLRSMDERDRRWLRLAPRAYLTSGPLPRAGRFNGGQKVNARLVLLALSVLYLSGLGELGRHVSAFASLGFLAALHGLAAGGAAVLVAFHVYLAVVHPTTRPALRGMTLGAVRRDWAEQHHADWVASLDDRSGPAGRER
jgi:formate dehydrogenase subunit gamma